MMFSILSFSCIGLSKIKHMKKIVLLALAAFTALQLTAQCGITFSVASNSNLGNPNSVVLTLNGTQAHAGFSVYIDWGDGTDPSLGFEESWIHTYNSAGTYQICVTFVAPTCVQENFCNSYTVSALPADICPLSVNWNQSGNSITVNATGSGAVSPVLSFHPDILSYLDNPFDLSGFQFQSQHSGTFNHTYSPAQSGESYMFCVGYGDSDEPVACEDNDYCASVTFGNPSAGLVNPVDFHSTIQVYPVPAESFINVHFSDPEENERTNWKIFATDGSIVQEGSFSGQLNTLLLPGDMPQGNYLLSLTAGSKTRAVPFLKL